MAKKKRKAASSEVDASTTYNEPLLRDAGILGKPPSYKEEEIDAHIAASMKFLDDYPNIGEVIIDLTRFYRSYLNPHLPGAKDSMKNIVMHSLTNACLVIQQRFRKPRQAFFRQVLMPTPFGSVRSFTEGVRAYLVPIEDDTKPIFHGEDRVLNRLAVEMDFDVTKPAREQILRFGHEYGMLEQQYCIYKSEGGEDTEQED